MVVIYASLLTMMCKLAYSKTKTKSVKKNYFITKIELLNYKYLVLILVDNFNMIKLIELFNWLVLTIKTILSVISSKFVNILPSKTDIQILLNSIDKSELNNAAERLINKHNLPLTKKEILKSFSYSRLYVKMSRKDDIYEKYLFTFSELLNININMFVALVKCNIDDNIDLDMYVNKKKPYAIGCSYEIYNLHRYRQVIHFYKKLINYYDFSVDDLDIPSECKLKINKYRNGKNRGYFSKLAN